MECLKIGQLAKRAGVSVDTIRYYERCGLLPAPRRTDSGYRIYSQASVDRILITKSMKELGFSLVEIADNLADIDAGEFRCTTGEARVQSVLGRVEQRIEQLVLLQTRIQAELVRCHAGACRLDGLPSLR